MWQGVFPAVETKFTQDDTRDTLEMERCSGSMSGTGCHGVIVRGSPSDSPMLHLDGKPEVPRMVECAVGAGPVLLTVNEAATRDGASPAKAGTAGLMVVPSPIYHADPHGAAATPKAARRASRLSMSAGRPWRSYRTPSHCAPKLLSF